MRTSNPVYDPEQAFPQGSVRSTSTTVVVGQQLSGDLGLQELSPNAGFATRG
jgi:hypothetical protein